MALLDIVRANNGRGEPTGLMLVAADKLPYTTIGYGNGRGGRLMEDAVDALGNERIYEEPMLAERRLDLKDIDTTDPGFHQESFLPASAETHGGEDVALFAKGPWAHLVSRTEEQSFIYYVMRHASGLDAPKPAGDDD